MQFIVFAAFAIVLSVPDSGPPWRTLTSIQATWAIVIAYVVLTTLVANWSTRMVERKLEREPAWLPAAQRRLAKGNTAIRAVLLLGLIASVYGTAWTNVVRGWHMPWLGGEWIRVSRIWGLDEVLILTPFLLSIVLSLIAIYPADRAIRQVALELRLWSAIPAHPVWHRRQFLSFMLRQHVLIILLPMIPIVVANDFAYRYSSAINKAAHLPWADQAVLVLMAGAVFLFAPVMLRFIWHTRILPPGDLRERLDALCRRVGMRYRRILIWESDGMVINAAVMGLFQPVRYVLLSDGLLEMMEDEKIEAVFGHEAGHVKKRHIEFYLLFAVLSMLVVGGIAELVMAAVRHWPELHLHWREIRDYLQVGAMGLIILIWGVGFGVVSRRFEWQADLFGARSVTPTAERCDRPCFLHGTASLSPPQAPSREHPFSSLVGTAAASSAPPGAGQRLSPVCATAADLFADALHRIALLNGIPIEARSWRHSSIANRMKLLRDYANDPARAASLERSVAIIKTILFLGTIVGLGIGVWLYWPA